MLLHQWVFLDEVEGVIRQFQRTGIAMASVPVVDALGRGEGGRAVSMWEWYHG